MSHHRKLRLLAMILSACLLFSGCGNLLVEFMYSEYGDEMESLISQAYDELATLLDDTMDTGEDEYIDPVGQYSFQGNLYCVYDYPCTWEEAYDYCAEADGELVTITSPEEQKFIEEILVDCEITFSWIGMTKEDGKWQWITGEQVTYNNWAVLEPSTFNAGKTAAYISVEKQESLLGILGGQGRWRSSEPEGSGEIGATGFICEWPGAGDHDSQQNEEKTETFPDKHVAFLDDTGYSALKEIRFAEQLGSDYEKSIGFAEEYHRFMSLDFTDYSELIVLDVMNSSLMLEKLAGSISQHENRNQELFIDATLESLSAYCEIKGMQTPFDLEQVRYQMALMKGSGPPTPEAADYYAYLDSIQNDLTYRKTLADSLEKVGFVKDTLDFAVNTYESYYEVQSYVAAAEAFRKSSQEFKEVVRLVAGVGATYQSSTNYFWSSHTTSIEQDISIALSDYIEYVEKEENNQQKLFAKKMTEETAKNIFEAREAIAFAAKQALIKTQAGQAISAFVSKHFASLLAKISAKTGVSVTTLTSGLATAGAVAGAIAIGTQLSVLTCNALFNNDKHVPAYMSMKYMGRFAELSRTALDVYDARLRRSPDDRNALLFHEAFLIYRCSQELSGTYYLQYLEGYATSLNKWIYNQHEAHQEEVDSTNFLLKKIRDTNCCGEE